MCIILFNLVRFFIIPLGFSYSRGVCLLKQTYFIFYFVCLYVYLKVTLKCQFNFLLFLFVNIFYDFTHTPDEDFLKIWKSIKKGAEKENAVMLFTVTADCSCPSIPHQSRQAKPVLSCFECSVSAYLTVLSSDGTQNLLSGIFLFFCSVCL